MQTQLISSGAAAPALHLDYAPARPQASAPAAIDSTPVPSEGQRAKKIDYAIATACSCFLGATLLGAVGLAYMAGRVGNEGPDSELSPAPEKVSGEKLGLIIGAALLGVTAISILAGIVGGSLYLRAQTPRATPLTPADDEQPPHQTTELQLEVVEPANQRI